VKDIIYRQVKCTRDLIAKIRCRDSMHLERLQQTIKHLQYQNNYVVCAQTVQNLELLLTESDLFAQYYYEKFRGLCRVCGFIQIGNDDAVQENIIAVQHSGV